MGTHQIPTYFNIGQSLALFATAHFPILSRTLTWNLKANWTKERIQAEAI